MILLPDNSQRAKNLLIVFYINAASQLAFLISTFMQYVLLQKIQKGNYTQAEAEANDVRHQFIAYTNIAIYIVTIVFFILWFRRAYNNLNLSGREYTKYPEGWAAGAWFVPFLNLVRPYQIMQEIWEKTQTATYNLVNIKSTTIIGWWWALWILNNVATNFVTRILTGNSIDDLITSTSALFICNIIESAALVCIIIIVKRMMVFEQNLQNSLLEDTEITEDSEDKLNFIV